MTHKEIQNICRKYSITNYNINDDMSIDVDDNVYLGFNGLRNIPLTFNKVSGDFYCDNNKLTTLIGAPLEVGNHFCCQKNTLTTLIGAPKKVGKSFTCYRNNLKSLEGAPEKVGDYFNCSNNKLSSLKGVSLEVSGEFLCYNNLVKLDYYSYISSVKRMNKIALLNES